MSTTRRNIWVTQHGLPSWVAWLSLLAVVLAVILVFLLVLYFSSEDPEPMIGPGAYPDHSNTVVFDVLEGWEVLHEEGVTRVVPADETLPAYRVEIKSEEQVDLVLNWNCTALREAAPRVARAALPWEVTPLYVSVPCAENAAIQQAYGRVDVTLADESGRNAVMYFAPIDGRRWAIVRSETYTGQTSAALVEAIHQTATTVHLKS